MAKKITDEECFRRLSELEPLIVLKIDTYKGWSNMATFIDKDFGEWMQTPKRVYLENRRHPKRAMLNREATNKKRYGASNVFANDKIKEKIRKSCLKNYGVENVAKNKDIQAKIQHTNISRYGGPAPMCAPSVKEKVLRTRCPYKLSDGRLLIETCRDDKLPTSTILRVMHACGVEAATELCNSYDPKTSMTYIEQVMSNMRGLERWNRTVEGCEPYRPDFKVNDSCYVDVDGLYWHSTAHQKNNRYHFDKRKKFEKKNINILQFREDEIVKKIDIVKSIINAKTDQYQKRYYARKLQINDVPAEQAKQFFAENHLMGWHQSKVVGLYNKDELVCALSYKISKKVLDIVRFASALNTVVVGGLSRLVAFLENCNDILEIISWVDLRYGNGSSLIKCGFTPVRDVLSWRWTDKINTYNRLRCRANMDDRGLTEGEHAVELGWYKIYDAGQRLYRRVKRE